MTKVFVEQPLASPGSAKILASKIRCSAQFLRYKDIVESDLCGEWALNYLVCDWKGNIINSVSGELIKGS